MSVGRLNFDGAAAPTVSIIMGAYNAGKTIREAIESILGQEFTDWEFVICDDGSTYDTLAICREYDAVYPGRFHVLANQNNRKLSATLNRCLSVARGKYIARMDADDISKPTRLAKQVAVLESRPEIDLVGTAMQRFGDRGAAGIVMPPERPNRFTLRRSIPFCHATIMARNSMYKEVGGYNESSRTARSQDVDLWFRFFDHGFVGINLNEPLYLVREDLAAISRRTFRTRWNGFLISINGYRRLNYPLHWYVRPFVQLSKGFIPFRVQEWYREWQKRHVKDHAAD